eukprot:SAG22_NODE_18904_length_280_cov_0.839779_1_plen_26_part_10
MPLQALDICAAIALPDTRAMVPSAQT